MWHIGGLNIPAFITTASGLMSSRLKSFAKSRALRDRRSPDLMGLPIVSHGLRVYSHRVEIFSIPRWKGASDGFGSYDVLERDYIHYQQSCPGELPIHQDKDNNVVKAAIPPRPLQMSFQDVTRHMVDVSHDMMLCAGSLYRAYGRKSGRPLKDCGGQIGLLPNTTVWHLGALNPIGLSTYHRVFFLGEGSGQGSSLTFCLSLAWWWGSCRV